jgi:hypothetical protein
VLGFEVLGGCGVVDGELSDVPDDGGDRSLPVQVGFGAPDQHRAAVAHWQVDGGPLQR